jgi:superfamily II DNA or RNA helicase
MRFEPAGEVLIVSEATKTEYHQLKLWLTRKVKGYAFNPAYKMKVWDGNKTYFKDGVVPMGLWKECLNACAILQTKFEIENKSDFPVNRDIKLEDVQKFCDEFFVNHKILDKITNTWVKFAPYDYQVDTAFKILKNKYCIGEVATSGGKSLVLSIVYFYILKHMKEDAKFLLVVPSITLVTQFYDDIVEFNIGANKDYDGGNPNPIDLRIEEIMSDKPRKYSGATNANLYIGCYQSLVEYDKTFFKKFYAVAVDEAHTCKSASLTKIMKQTFMNASYRFGVSGTFPPDTSFEILTIQSLLGPKQTKIEAKTLMEKKVITPMSIKAIVLNYQDNEMLDRLKVIKSSGDGKAVLDAERYFVHNSELRMKFILNLLEKTDKNTLMLFYTIEYGEMLEKRIKEHFPDRVVHYIDGNVAGQKRNVIKADMEVVDKEPRILIASYGTLSTGVSMKAIFNIIFADSYKSEQIVIQSIGRGLRLHPDKQTAHIFDLVDIFDEKVITQQYTTKPNILYKHFLEREKFYQNREYPYRVIKVNLNP